MDCVVKDHKNNNDTNLLYKNWNGFYVYRNI